MKKAKKVAFAGVFSALCFVFLYMGSVFQTFDLSAAALASIIVLIAIIELGNSWAFGVYLATSVISLLIMPQKSAAIFFASFVGIYPILKVFLNKIKPIWLSYLAKFSCLNLYITATIFTAQYLFYFEEEFFGQRLLIYLLSNITFLSYDLALERLAITYIKRIKPRISKRQ